MSLQITELFYSIQGESTWSGLPCGFVRLSGCNLRCRYCDTQYAYEPGDAMEPAAIVQQMKQFDCTHVTITGGEPLFQPETPELIVRLLQSNFKVSMETNGSLDIGTVNPGCIKILDLKCPSSGMQPHNRLANLRLLGSADQVKFVIADREDYDFALGMRARLPLDMPAGNILFSPVHGELPAAELAQWMLRDRARARLQIQLHKLIWPDQERGV